MKHIEVHKASRLDGSVRIQGSKNSSLALMAASCLSGGTVILENVPDISDVHIFIDILKKMGAKAGFLDTNHLIINSEGISETIIDPHYSKKIRPSYYFIGSLLSRYKKITLGYPGGDRIGQRPIDQHIKGFKQMGAHFEFFDDSYTVMAERLKGCEIFFDVVSAGATLNLMMGAVLAEGSTTLYNAARDPEVVDTAILLNKMGARIHGAGTSTVKIDGVGNLSGCSHSAIPDRLIAGTYLMSAGINGGRVTVENIVPEHIQPLMHKLTEAGIEFNISENSVTAISDGRIKPIKIIAQKFPMFETDFQQPASVLLLNAKGESTVNDRIYPERSNHCEQLRKMGANIKWDSGTAYINGGTPLKGTYVHAYDIRAGACLILAGLLAEGTTCITGVDQIERGFTDIVKDFSLLGADIRLICKDDKIQGRDEPCLLKNAALR